MRRLTKKKALTLVKEFDAFPKVPESYVESSASGGTGRTAAEDPVRPRGSVNPEEPWRWRSLYSSYPVSLIAFTFMAVLAFLEFFVYRDTWMKYEYEVDKDYSR